jgi:anaerobic ribonucleoside-triphosphate reductase
MEQGHYELAKKYILYRQKHKERRDAKNQLMETYEDIFFSKSDDADFKRENANINTDAPMGIMLKLGTEGAKQFVCDYILKPEYVKMHKEGFAHLHDLDFSIITLNCCVIDILKLMEGGFCTGHGFLREPKSIRSAAAIACIALQSNQNDEFRIN